ncbi:MAG: DJ-1/PfpI family protein [Candidatus Omnitrophica bacterium]|nr:DJ-1/PfpI family protein [Candidatus Omnitrophota bacterium]
MPKKAIVILAEGFEEIEAVTPIDVLRRAGVDVIAAGLTDVKIKGSRGLVVVADKKLEESGTDFDACVLPGGSLGAKNLAASDKVRSLLIKMNQEGKIIAAICAAPALVLIPTGILKGKAATCYPGMQDSFGKNTAYKEDDVVVDGNIITSRGPATALSFALAIAEKLCGKETVIL